MKKLIFLSFMLAACTPNPDEEPLVLHFCGDCITWRTWFQDVQFERCTRAIADCDLKDWGPSIGWCELLEVGAYCKPPSHCGAVSPYSVIDRAVCLNEIQLQSCSDIAARVVPAECYFPNKEDK